MVSGKGVEVDPQERLRKALAEVKDKTSDLTIPLMLIAQQWFKSNRAIFTLQGPGKYVDYKPGPPKHPARPSPYEKFKIRHLGSQYPMLRLAGTLEASLTDQTDDNAVAYIVNRISLALGTKVATAKGAPYAWFLHYGTSKMAARPVVLFGNEQVAPGALNTRVDQWRKLILDYVMKVSRKQ